MIFESLLRRKTEETPALPWVNQTPPPPPSAADRLEAARSRYAELAAEVARFASERARCESEAARHRAVIDAAAASRGILESLHQLHAEGQAVTPAGLADAEAEFQRAHTASRAAQVAEAGALRAAATFADKAEQLSRQVVAARTAAVEAFAEVVRERISASRANLAYSGPS